MVSNNCHVQTGSCMLIAVPLDDTCSIIEGAPVHVTAGVGTATGTWNRTAGTDYSGKNFGGAACGPEQMADDVDKWLDIKGEFCLKSWAFMSATSGNPTIVDEDGNVIGYASLTKRSAGVCDAVQKPRVSVVIVRRAATDDAGCGSTSAATGMTPCVAHFFPTTANWKWDLPPFDDTRASIPFESTGYSNAKIGAGPLNLWPATADPDLVPTSAAHAEVFVPCASLPAVDCDSTISHPAVAARTGS